MNKAAKAYGDSFWKGKSEPAFVSACSFGADSSPSWHGNQNGGLFSMKLNRNIFLEKEIIVFY
ncbi:hypothetical protein [Domibacillus sp. DTU_2020_1001157_1_SI_ALB_TIR_016]|uniref:hypothetical protein n=1 Tax=Domibacillus sp. DTU_2020_1001157_1_SI_ALB_TIR_016 TaxID=3077789 RepID=UPI003977AB88